MTIDNNIVLHVTIESFLWWSLQGDDNAPSCFNYRRSPPQMSIAHLTLRGNWICYSAVVYHPAEVFFCCCFPYKAGNSKPYAFFLLFLFNKNTQSLLLRYFIVADIWKIFRLSLPQMLSPINGDGLTISGWKMRNLRVCNYRERERDLIWFTISSECTAEYLVNV